MSAAISVQIARYQQPLRLAIALCILRSAGERIYDTLARGNHPYQRSSRRPTSPIISSKAPSVPLRVVAQEIALGAFAYYHHSAKQGPAAAPQVP
jgi:hypothetical protein